MLDNLYNINIYLDLRLEWFYKTCKYCINFLFLFQNVYGNYECRYILVQLDDYSGRTFIIEDNRAELDQKGSSNILPTLTLSQ